MKKLRIAQFVTTTFTNPQPPEIIYAPIHLMLELTEHLSRRGHEMTVYAPEGSNPRGAKLETLGLPPLKQDRSTVYFHPSTNAAEKHTSGILWKQYAIQHMFEAARQGQYDILHIHPVDVALPLARAYPSVPVVYTLHDPITAWRRQMYTLFASPNQWYVSISQAQRQPAPELNYAATVYNAIELDRFPFSRTADNHLLFVGRLLPQKGAAESIQAARQAGESLVIAGPRDQDDDTYWQTQIAPYLNDQIHYAGVIERHRLSTHYRKAKALLMPISWEEPFGLVMIEAMACGTPVIAFRRGSVPEVVIDGQTGFIVDTVEEMVTAIKRIDTINRRACREHVAKNFSLEKMIDGYEAAYSKILASTAPAP